MATEVSLARDLEKKKVLLKLWKKKEPKFGTEVEVIITLHGTKKYLMNEGSPDVRSNDSFGVF